MAIDLEALLGISDEDLTQRWEHLQQSLEHRFGRAPGIEPILFLIGIQSRGRGYEPGLGKETKQDLIMEGTRCAFETLGLYERVGIDSNGLPLWKRSNLALPRLSLNDQERLLRLAILSYFDAREA